jgi:hypothetical protein
VAERPWQLGKWHLPTPPTDATGSRETLWAGGESAELDAIDANRLRGMCDDRIRQHADKRRLAVLDAAERNEREPLTRCAATVTRSARR